MSRIIRQWLLRATATTVCIIVSTSALMAQNGRWLPPAGQPPLRPSLGLPDTSFIVMSYTGNAPTQRIVGSDTATFMADIWPYLDAMGVRVWRVSASDGTVLQFDSIVQAAPDTAGIVLVYDSVDNAGASREIKFFMYGDTAQSSLKPNKFAFLRDADTLFNSANEGRTLKEMRYDAAMFSPGDTIAKHITFDWNPKQVFRYYIRYPDPVPDTIPDTDRDNADSLQNSSRFLGKENRTTIDDGSYYVTVAGHLFSDSLSLAISDTTRLLAVHIIYEIPKTMPLRLANGTISIDSLNNRELLDTTIYVRKSDLKPPPEVVPNFDKFREATYLFNLQRCQDGTHGPSSLEKPDNASHHMDIRVQWLGAAPVALRSIALRDVTAQYKLGVRPSDSATRVELFSGLHRLLVGPSGDTLRRSIMRVEAGDEPSTEEYAGYNMIDTMLRSRYTRNQQGEDLGLTAFVVHGGGDARTNPPVIHQFIHPDESTPEIGYINSPHLVPNANHDIPGFKLPSLIEHNGDSARYQIPELHVTDSGVIAYEEILQNRFYGRYIPGPASYQPFPQNSTDLFALGRSAVIARDSGKHLIPVVGIHGYLGLEVDSTESPTTIFERYLHAHIPEAGEIRASANLALCYGARGVFYFWLGSYPHHLKRVYPSDSTRRWYIGHDEAFGPGGYRTSDTALDYTDLDFRTEPDSGWVLGHTMEDIYVGWKNRTRELKKLNRWWLPAIGNYLMKNKIRWRDAYSIHLQERRPTAPRDNNIQPRPLPDDEIVTQIETFKRGDTIPDPPHKTYIELGLFYTHPDSLSGHGLDTNYLFVVNRRVFERPEDIPDTSARGRLMDSLAEVRTVKLQFNLQRTTFRQYEFVRVREIHPDTTRLPLTSASRMPLDTIIPADKAAELTLGPGRAALLQITYVQPDTSVIDGHLEFNNQRKLAYHDNRHFVTYRKQTAENHPLMPPNMQPFTDDYVYMRRSYPVDATGIVQWEPMEIKLSINGSNSRFQNLHPSLTLRPGGDTVTATVVWSCHPAAASSGDTITREVVLRNIAFGPTGFIGMGDIESVDTYAKTTFGVPQDTTMPFGTPVVCRLDSGYAVAWSDAGSGIKAKVRRLPASSGWWSLFGSYSASKLVRMPFNGSFSSPFLGVGRLPSVPAFAHIVNDAWDCGIVWQQPTAYPFNNLIGYARLRHSNGPGGTILLDTLNNRSLTGDVSGRYRFPSIDQTQDAFGRVQEVAVWQVTTYLAFADVPGQMRTDEIQLKSVYTDPMGRSWGWGSARYYVGLEFSSGNVYWQYGRKLLYPSIASLNDVDVVSGTDSIKAFFSTVYFDPKLQKMYQRVYRYTETFHPTHGGEYTYGGEFSGTAASQQKQRVRQAVVFEGETHLSAPALRTTREFFAKPRPAGYTASGRQIDIPMDDSTGGGFSFMLYDPWIAGDAATRGLSMTARDSSARIVDSLPQGRALFRTAYFTASDTTSIGCELRGALLGTGSYSTRKLRVNTELIDSATNTVVALLDSVQIGTGLTSYGVVIDTTLDLLSSTYYIRCRIDTVGFVSPPRFRDSRYPVSEISGDVESEGMAKARRLTSATRIRGRIDAIPNPFTSSTELRFSVVKAGRASIRIFDQLGRQVVVPMEGAWMEPGRYAIDFESGDLRAGSYVVELAVDGERSIEKIIISR